MTPEEARRRGGKALDRIIRRAHGPKSARLYQYDTDAHERRDENDQTWKGGNR